MGRVIAADLPARVKWRRQLVGREADAAAVRALILDEEAPLLTLTGPGGMGKTALAQFVSYSLNDAFAGHTHFVDLTPVTEPALILDRIAQSLDLAGEDFLAPIERLAEFYGERRALLILDNFEHLIDAATDVAHLLALCPNLQVLVTSREALRLRDERVYPLTPLGLPAAAQVGDAGALGQVPAVDLFVRRARAVQPDFALSPGNAVPVAAVVGRLDGLPLAIELAAARIRLLSPEALLAQLESSPLQTLTGGARDLPARQQTIRDTIAWSFNLLEPSEARLFRRLGVFAGGFSLEAVKAVAVVAFDDTAIDARRDVGSLLDKSLIQRLPDNPAISPESRYGLLVTLQAFALEQLQAASEEAQARAAHLAWYLDFAEAAVPHYRQPEHQLWIGRIAAEEDNLRAALDRATADAAPGPARAATAIQLAGALGDYWQYNSRVLEGERRLQELLPYIPARDLNQEVVTAGGHTALAHEARVLSAAGTMAWHLGDFPRAQRLHEQSMRLYSAIGDDDHETDSRYNVAVQLSMQGRYAEALPLYESVASYFAQRSDPNQLARALSGLAITTSQSGDDARALEIEKRALSLSRQTNNKLVMVMLLNNMAQAYLRQGELDQAEDTLMQSVQVAQEVTVAPHFRFDHHLVTGRLREAQGDHAAALRAARQAVELADAVSSRRYLADGLEQVAFACYHLEQAARGARLLGAASAMRGRMGAADVRENAAYYNERESLLRAALGEDRYAAQWAEGQTLSRAAAVALALDDFGPASGGHPAPTSRPAQAADPLVELTPREREVALLMARRQTNEEIADELFITVNTVEKHAGNILGKLQMRNRIELAQWGAARGLLDQP